MLPGGLLSTKYSSDLAIVRTKTQWAFLAALLIIFLVIVPLFASPYWFSQLQRIAVVLLIVLGLHILSGLCGLISIGQAAFALIGAYAVTTITYHYDMSGWLCLPLAALAAGVIGLIFGLPFLR